MAVVTVVAVVVGWGRRVWVESWGSPVEAGVAEVEAAGRAGAAAAERVAVVTVVKGVLGVAWVVQSAVEVRAAEAAAVARRVPRGMVGREVV
jgi:hypothetical protein